MVPSSRIYEAASPWSACSPYLFPERPEAGRATKHSFRRLVSHLCISDADVLSPLQSSSTRPTSATDTRKRVRVTTTHIALKGGSLAFADFHVTPPLGSSIATRPPGPPTAPPVPGSAR